MEKESGRREDVLRQEISDLQQVNILNRFYERKIAISFLKIKRVVHEKQPLSMLL